MLSNMNVAVAFCNPSELGSTPCHGQSRPLSPRPYHKLALHVAHSGALLILLHPHHRATARPRQHGRRRAEQPAIAHHVEYLGK